MLQRLHHVADEALAVHVGDARIRVARADRMADRMHEVRLAETDATVDEQRVVGLAGILPDLLRRGLRELVALADDEVLEGRLGVQAPTDHQALGATAATAEARRPRSTAGLGGSARSAAGGRDLALPDGTRGTAAVDGWRPGTDLDRHDRRVAADGLAQQLTDARQQVAVDPVDDILIRGEQLERADAFDGLQRPDPGVVLLLRQLVFEHADAA